MSEIEGRTKIDTSMEPVDRLSRLELQFEQFRAEHVDKREAPFTVARRFDCGWCMEQLRKEVGLGG